jgi:hypothetical protein
MFREDFPQLLRAVVGTYWPPLVQDKNCESPASAAKIITEPSARERFWRLLVFPKRRTLAMTRTILAPQTSTPLSQVT